MFLGTGVNTMKSPPTMDGMIQRIPVCGVGWNWFQKLMNRRTMDDQVFDMYCLTYKTCQLVDKSDPRFIDAIQYCKCDWKYQLTGDLFSTWEPVVLLEKGHFFEEDLVDL